MERHAEFIRKASSTLVFEPGWSEDNLTGSWRAQRPVLDPALCVKCDLCWVACPDTCIDRSKGYAIDYRYCKGCGLCASVCGKMAIRMVDEP